MAPRALARKRATRVRARLPGFTLVELLVVVTIIGILVALLLPAVQAAREAARMTQCRNNLKQISLAALNHEQVHHWFPTGGWNLFFVGDPTSGFGPLQPGGFFYNILPYMEQQPLHDMAIREPKGSVLYQQLSMQMTETPLAGFSCPTRRPAALRPVAAGNIGQMQPNYGSYLPKDWYQGDYSANGGSAAIGWGGAQTFAAAANPQTAGWLTPAQLAEINGVVIQRSQIKVADITDGTSCTYLVGEKYLNVDAYFTGNDWGDDQAAFTGDCDDQCRWTGLDTTTNGVTTIGFNPPLPDMPGSMLTTMFGSAHLSGFQMAFCDGSVQKMNFSINPEIHRRLGNRHDGLPIDGKTW